MFDRLADIMVPLQRTKVWASDCCIAVIVMEDLVTSEMNHIIDDRVLH